MELIGVEEVMKMTSLKNSSIRRYVREGRMPAPLKLAKTCSRWRRSDIEKWIADGCPPTTAKPVAAE